MVAVYHNVQGGEARSMARGTESWCFGSPTIPCRSCSRGRLSSVVDALDDLRRKELPHDVKWLCKIKRKRKGEKGGLGVAGAHRKWRSTVAVVAKLEGWLRAAWALLKWGAWGKIERVSRSSYSYAWRGV